MRRGVAHPLPGCRVPRRARERDTSVRQAEGKGARTAPTRGREGAAAVGRLRMEGRERFLHPSIGGAGPHRASGPGALARRRIQETPPLCVCSGAARGLASEDGLDACHPRALTCARRSAASVGSASALRPLRSARSL